MYDLPEEFKAVKSSFGLAALGTLLAALQPAPAQTPSIAAVLNQATMTPSISPGMPVLVNGTNLAGGITDCSSRQPPLSCGGVSATVNGRAVPVRSAFSNQVVVYVPVDAPLGQASVIVRNHLGNSSAPFFFSVQTYAPGLSNLYDSRSGRTIGLFTDQAQRTIAPDNPASPGQLVTLWGVGWGPTTPVIPTGQTGNASTTTAPLLFVAGRQVMVLSSGMGCGFLCEPGMYQVTFTVPLDLPGGDQPVHLEIGGQRSNDVLLVVGQTVPQPVVGFLQSLYDPKGRSMSPGMLAMLGGGGFRTDQGSAVCTPDASVWPLACAGVRALFNGRPAALQAVLPNAIVLQIPTELVPGNVTVVVERSSGSQLLRSAAYAFTLDAVSPALATQTALPPYVSAVIAGTNVTAFPGYPAAPGDMLFIQAVGLGATVPPQVTGFSPVIPARTVLSPTLTVGGRTCEGVMAEVLPGSIGVYRITATLPKNLPDGDLPIVLEIGGRRSQDGLMLPVSSRPVIAAVTNAASGVPGVVSGSWVTIYGRSLAPSTRQWTEDDIIYDWLPTTLNGVVVAFNDIAAVISFASPTQLNVLAPDNLPPGPVHVTVQSALGWQQTQSVVRPYSPGLFVTQAPPGTYLAALHTDWSYVARPGQLPPPLAGRPARPGEVIVFYGTGFGPTTPAVSGRQRYNGVAPLANPGALSMLISGRPAQVVFSGMVGNGLYQINAVVPDLPDGDHEVVAVIGGEASPRFRFIPVQR